MSTKEIGRLARDYREAQAFIRQLEEEADAIKAQIIDEMAARGVDTLQADIFTVRWTPVTSSRVDTAAFKRELPDLADRYTRTMEVRRFSVA